MGWMTLKLWLTIGRLFYTASNFVHHFIAIGKFILEPRNAQFGSKLMIPCPVWPWHLADDFERDWAPLLYYCQTLFIIWNPWVNSNWSYSLETLNFVSKSVIFFSHVRGIFDRWPEQITGHLFHTTLSFVHNFKAISESKLGLQSTNTQFGSKLVIFFTHVTSKIYGWPWKTIGCLFYASSSLCIMS